MADDVRGVPPWRRVAALICVCLSALLLPIGLLAAWANSTLYNSDTFSQRAVDLLDSPAVRRELADKLTQTLAESGNQQAVNFRPAFKLAIEAAVDTDTFRSIFRSAIRQTHQGLLAGQKGATLDLSDSVSIIAGTLALPENAKPGQAEEKTLGSSLGDVTKQLSDLYVWQMDDVTAGLAGIGIGGAIAAAAAAIALAADRRRMVRRLGWVVVGDGLFVAALVFGVQWYAGRLVSDEQLASAIRAAVSNGMADLRSIGLWTAGYGLIMAAAARPEGAARLTPARVSTAVARWVERRRATTGGTVALGVVAILAGLVLVGNPTFYLRLAVLVAGMWLAYFGVTELVGLIRAAVPAAEATDQAAHPRRRLAIMAGVTAALLLMVSAGFVLTTRRAAEQANAAGELRCNGDADLCDLPLNLAVFPGTHNSMSSTLYPNWLFAEHIKTIGGQLNAGARALLIDTHYGVPSSARYPGSNQQVVVTDRAAELRSPTGEGANIDPAIAQRAADMAARFPAGANSARDLYLCHNFCEMGAIKFTDGLGEIKTFLDSHPDEVVITIIQDATTPAETADRIVRAGLEDEVYTLQPDRPLPTLGDMIRSRRNLLVFAEGGGEGGPPWYHKAYQGWFQETTYTFTDPKQMDCAPNRGHDEAPLFLMNHWLAVPAGPTKAAAVNKRAFLEDRIRRCLAERGYLPTIVAVDFSERGELFPAMKDLNQALLDQVRQVRGRGTPPTTRPPGAPQQAAPAPTSSAIPISASTQLPSLTGGDPARFCQAAPAMLEMVSAWALADLVALPATRGLSDLAFAPGVVRVENALDPVAPVEVVQQHRLLHDRARAAEQALRDLGLDDARIAELADLTQSQLASPEDPDSVEVQDAVLDRLRSFVGDERLKAAAEGFEASNPEPPNLFDLGDVSEDVARDSGYACVLEIG